LQHFRLIKPKAKEVIGLDYRDVYRELQTDCERIYSAIKIDY
jgi:hypothetical protein